jgi:hypothetical protein
MKAIFALVLSTALGTTACFADDDMTKTVTGFYGAYATFHPSDGIPDAQARARYELYISPALDALLAQGSRAEEKFGKANKNSPPMIEGDLFTSNFEGATSYKIGACSGDAKLAKCTVALTYDNRKDKPVLWSDTVFLVATPSGWRVDDIGYGANTDFGNKGKLSETLHSIIADAGN